MIVVNWVKQIQSVCWFLIAKVLDQLLLPAAIAFVYAACAAAHVVFSTVSLLQMTVMMTTKLHKVSTLQDHRCPCWDPSLPRQPLQLGQPSFQT